MTKSAAVLATFSDARMVKTRSVLQIIVEIPIENADDAMKALGGFPRPGEERWVGIALAPKERKEVEARSSAEEPSAHNGLVAGSNPAAPIKERRAFHELKPSAQAGIRCGEVEFWDFLTDTVAWATVENVDQAADVVRHTTAVNSRSEFDRDAAAKQRWNFLESAYEGWKTDHRYKDVRHG